MATFEVVNPNFAADLASVVLGMPLVRFYGVRFTAGWGNATVDYSVKVLAPATGPLLVARGTALAAGRTLSVGEAKVFWVADGTRTLCATGMATVRNFAAAAESRS